MNQQIEQSNKPAALPSVERIQQELATARSIDDFFGREGIFARLFASTLEQMMQAMKISSTPRPCKSLTTLNQKLAPSPPSPTQWPKTSR